MFSDIRGFTTISEEVQPEEVVEMLNQYLTRMEDIIEFHGGRIEKFIGDAIMAVFMPVHGFADPTIRAVDAGLGMVNELSHFNVERMNQKKFPIRIGVGIATGEVLIGILGGKEGRRNVTIIGPVVNEAAKMEKFSKKAGKTFVVVCPQSAEKIKGERWAIPLVKEGESTLAFEIVA